MRRQSAEDTAIRLVAAFQKNGTNRVRISRLQMKETSGRTKLHSVFVIEVINHMADYGVTLAQLSRGGFGAIATDSLNGAKTLPSSHISHDPIEKVVSQLVLPDAPDFDEE